MVSMIDLPLCLHFFCSIFTYSIELAMDVVNWLNALFLIREQYSALVALYLAHPTSRYSRLGSSALARWHIQIRSAHRRAVVSRCYAVERIEQD